MAVANLKIPPHSIEAERAVLGCIFRQPEMIHQAEVTPEDFYRNDHRTIFRFMLKVDQQGQEPDVIAVGEALDLANELDNVAGMGYLMELADMPGSTSNLTAYADVVRQRSMLREGISVGHEISTAGFDGDLLGMQAVMAESLTRISSGAKDYWTPAESIRATVENVDRAHKGERMGLRFGIPAMDKRYPQGMEPGDLIVMGARPAMGKTSVALNIALKQECPVLMVSLEMPQDQLTKRCLSIMAQIPYQGINLGQMSDPEWKRFEKAALDYESQGVHVFDKGGATISQVIGACVKAKQVHDVGLIIIDYCQLINGDKSQTRNDEIGEITRQLKALAKRLKLPILLLCQLNRKLEERQNKRPIMSDLRESGQIEQDADMIIFLYRDAIYNDVPDNCIEFITEKVRNGPIGFCKAGWEPEFMMLKGGYL